MIEIEDMDAYIKSIVIGGARGKSWKDFQYDDDFLEILNKETLKYQLGKKPGILRELFLLYNDNENRDPKFRLSLLQFIHKITENDFESEGIELVITKKV